MATINKSNTLMSEKDYWRISPELIRDALKLLNITQFNTDVCCADIEVKIEQAIFLISEDMDALQRDCFVCHLTTSFCNPPFSKNGNSFKKPLSKLINRINRC